MSTLFFMVLLGIFDTSLSQNWKLIFDDEFDGKELNSSNWANTRTQSHGYPYELEIYEAANVYLQNGSLVLKTKYQPTTKNGVTYPYTSGVVTSQNKFSHSYGKFEIRAKLPTEQFKHAWPAIWLQKQSGACYEEIDIMEQWIGHDNNVLSTSYHWNPSNASECAPSFSKAIGKYPPNGQTIDFSKEFHIWQLIWNKTEVAVWIDNNFVCKLTQDQAPMPYEPEYIILNTAVCGASYCGGTSGIPKDVTAYFYIDYVRVYEAEN
eukprot:495248_1